MALHLDMRGGLIDLAQVCPGKFSGRRLSEPSTTFPMCSGRLFGPRLLAVAGSMLNPNLVAMTAFRLTADASHSGPSGRECAPV